MPVRAVESALKPQRGKRGKLRGNLRGKLRGNLRGNLKEIGNIRNPRGEKPEK